MQLYQASPSPQCSVGRSVRAHTEGCLILLTSTSTPTLKSLASCCQIRDPPRPVQAGLYEQTNTMADNLYLLLGPHFIIDCLYKITTKVAIDINQNKL